MKGDMPGWFALLCGRICNMFATHIHVFSKAEKFILEVKTTLPSLLIGLVGFSILVIV